MIFGKLCPDVISLIRYAIDVEMFIIIFVSKI